MTPMDPMEKVLRSYILEKFLPGESPEELTDSTPLVTGGILDSVAALELVAFLEERYGFEFQAHEVNVENINTISDITRFVRSKL